MAFNSLKNPGERVNAHPQGFDFDQSMFENLIDTMTPMSQFTTILGVKSVADLDRFCIKVYHMKFKDAYTALSAASRAKWISTFGELARSGNNTAIKVIAESILKLNEDQNKKEFKISICSDLPEDDEPSEDDK